MHTYIHTYIQAATVVLGEKDTSKFEAGPQAPTGPIPPKEAKRSVTLDTPENDDEQAYRQGAAYKDIGSPDDVVVIPIENEFREKELSNRYLDVGVEVGVFVCVCVCVCARVCLYVCVHDGVKGKALSNR